MTSTSQMSFIKLNNNNLKTFTTQFSQPSNFIQTKTQFKQYVDQLDSKITFALKSQNTSVNIKKKQLQYQLQLIQQRKDKQSYKMRKMQQYFVKYCQAVLKQDIQKWTKNDQFFKQLFKMYQNKINKRTQENTIIKSKILNLEQQVKLQLKQLRKIYLSCNKKVEHQLIYDVQLIKQQIQNHRKKKTNQRDSFIAKSFTKDTRTKTQISLPSLMNFNPQNQNKLFALKNNLKIRKDRLNTQISQIYNTQHLITQPTQNLKMKTKHQSSVSNFQTNQDKLGYLMPIKTLKIKYQSPLIQLEKLLQWYKKDQQFIKEDDQKWFNKVIFNQRHYKKIKQYLKKNSRERVRRISTQR